MRQADGMIIIAGTLHVSPDDRDRAQETPEILGADVAKYRISAVESP